MPTTTHPYADLPGGDLVEEGLADLEQGRQTVPAFLVASFATRLRRLGVPVPAARIEEPELRLYQLLEQELGAAAHARYNDLARLIDSFADSYWCLS